jgi:hypothetical protein
MPTWMKRNHKKCPCAHCAKARREHREYWRPVNPNIDQIIPEPAAALTTTEAADGE